MSTIGLVPPPVQAPLPQISKGSGAADAAMLTKAADVNMSVAVEAPVVDAAVIEARRMERAARAAEQIANVNVLGSTRFVNFIGAGGQLVTRFTNTETGKVTYMPEQDVFSLAARSNLEHAETLVQLSA